jgi:hypothetical protein
MPLGRGIPKITGPWPLDSLWLYPTQNHHEFIRVEFPEIINPMGNLDEETNFPSLV